MKSFVHNENLVKCVLQLTHKRGVHMSTIYRPVNVTPPQKPGQTTSKRKDEGLSKSLRLMIDLGLIKHSSCFGTYHLLPVALKAMEKLVKLVDHQMTSLPNCQKLQMPILTATSLWKTTGRMDECRPELMKIEDRHGKEFLLSPTHEESICDLVKNPPPSYRHLPLRLYQITDKFRDEHRPRFGLLRARQFLMKDLYTFDTSLETATQTFQAVNKVYSQILNSLNLPWLQCQGSTGTIGGLFSDEFHVVSDIGEDSILTCSSCQASFNSDLLENAAVKAEATSTGAVLASDSLPKCIKCGSTSLSSSSSIEVGHSFLLGDKYTKPLQTLFVSESSEKLPMQMGCYGLGVSRLLAASLEVNSSADNIRWPVQIAPYLASILPPKEGSKEDQTRSQLAPKLYSNLMNILPNDVILDDRTNLTIGKRFQDNKRLGIPYVFVCGKGLLDPAGPLIEFHDLNAGHTRNVNIDEAVKLMYDAKSEIKLV